MKFPIRLLRLPFGTMRCSFCHRSNHQVEKLISNHPRDLRRTYICDACVAVCDAILQGDFKPLGEKVLHVASPESERRSAHCSFCRKSQPPAGKLIHSRQQERAICPACVAVCNSILSNPTAGGSPASTEAASGKPLLAGGGARATSKRWWRFWRKIGSTGLPMFSPDVPPQQARNGLAGKPGFAASPAEGAS